MNFTVNRRACLGAGLSAAAWPLFAAGSLAAEFAAPTLAGADRRPGLDLDGTWRYSVDPYRDGVAGFHGEPVGPRHQRYFDGDVDAVSRADPTAFFEFDMRRSPTASLPASWLTHDVSLRHFQGLMWYQRAFEARPARGRRAFLRFGAANYRAMVYLNGAFIGGHEGGFTPFAFEVTGRLRDGENWLTVGVDSDHSAQSVPPLVTDWETYGGLTRPVRLIETSPTFIDEAWVRLTRAGDIAVSVRLNGPQAPGRPVRVRIPELGFVLRGRSDGAGLWEARAPAPDGLARWSPDEPKLYDLRIETAGDELVERIGFRTIETRGDEVLLNGSPVFLRGICLHEEEIGPNPARTITRENARALLSVAKEGLGCNFVRLAHYPHSEVMTRMADELGLMVWSEIPVYWRVDFANADTLALARRMQTENIARDRNRASVVMWSVANETPAGAARDAFLAQLAADVRTLDDTRLVCAALFAGRREEGGTSVFEVSDTLAEHVDVMGVNTYNGWYTPDRLDALPGFQWRQSYRKPLVFSEFGADAKAGFHDAELKRKFSEEFQAEFYRKTLAMCDNIPFLRGTMPWILKDFRSPRRQHPIYQQGWNRKGVISETGERKRAFAVLADYYRVRSS